MCPLSFLAVKNNLKADGCAKTRFLSEHENQGKENNLWSNGTEKKNIHTGREYERGGVVVLVNERTGSCQKLSD